MVNKKNSRGMTLIEIIIALTVFAIASLILIDGFLMTTNMNRRSASLTTAGSTASTIVDKNSDDDIPFNLLDRDSYDFEIKIASETFTVDGNYITSTIDDEASDYKRKRIRFVPNPTPSPTTGP